MVKSKKLFASIYVYLILFLMYLPILVLIAFSFTEATNIGVWTGFSLNLYARLFQSQEIMVALGNTLIIAFISAAISTLLGTAEHRAFYSRKRTSKPSKAYSDSIVNAEIVMHILNVYSLCRSVIFGDNRSSVSGLCSSAMSSCRCVCLHLVAEIDAADPHLYEVLLIWVPLRKNLVESHYSAD
jgi:spermidine/putrescine transport system permease protein